MAYQVGVLVVGNIRAGKSALVKRSQGTRFPETYLPTTFDLYQKDVDFEGQQVQLQIWDPTGAEEIDRSMCYVFSNVVIICFAKDDREDFLKVPKIVEEMEGAPKRSFVPTLLVGTKMDLPESVNYHEGKEMANKYGATYMECSSKTGEGVDLIFKEALNEAFNAARKQQSQPTQPTQPTQAQQSQPTQPTQAMQSQASQAQESQPTQPTQPTQAMQSQAQALPPLFQQGFYWEDVTMVGLDAKTKIMARGTQAAKAEDRWDEVGRDLGRLGEKIKEFFTA